MTGHSPTAVEDSLVREARVLACGGCSGLNAIAVATAVCTHCRSVGAICGQETTGGGAEGGGMCV